MDGRLLLELSRGRQLSLLSPRSPDSSPHRFVMLRLDLTVTLLVAAVATVVLLCIFTNAAGVVLGLKGSTARSSAPNAASTDTQQLLTAGKLRAAATQPVTLQRAASQMSTETLFGDDDGPKTQLKKSSSDVRRTQSFAPPAQRIAAFDFAAETSGTHSPPQKKLPPPRVHLSRSVSALPL